jgi:hypothetical protein
LKTSTKAETNLHLNDFKAKTTISADLTTGGTKGSGPSRIDIRSQNRLQTSLQQQNRGFGGGVGEENSLLLDDDEDNMVPASVEGSRSDEFYAQTSPLQMAIIDRRSKIMTSVIRDHQPQPGFKYARNRRQSMAKPDVVIDFFAMCDDIYVCDWV